MRIWLLLLFVLFLFKNKVEACEENQSANGVSDCENLKFDDDDDMPGAKYCCFAKGKDLFDNEEIKECWALTEALYDKIDDYIDGFEDAKAYSDLSIDCGSNYLMLSLLSLIILLL